MDFASPEGIYFPFRAVKAAFALNSDLVYDLVRQPDLEAVLAEIYTGCLRCSCGTGVGTNGSSQVSGGWSNASSSSQIVALTSKPAEGVAGLHAFFQKTLPTLPATVLSSEFGIAEPQKPSSNSSLSLSCETLLVDVESCWRYDRFQGKDWCLSAAPGAPAAPTGSGTVVVPHAAANGTAAGTNDTRRLRALLQRDFESQAAESGIFSAGTVAELGDLLASLRDPEEIADVASALRREFGDSSGGPRRALSVGGSAGASHTTWGNMSMTSITPTGSQQHGACFSETDFSTEAALLSQRRLYHSALKSAKFPDSCNAVVEGSLLLETKSEQDADLVLGNQDKFAYFFQKALAVALKAQWTQFAKVFTGANFLRAMDTSLNAGRAAKPGKVPDSESRVRWDEIDFEVLLDNQVEFLKWKEAKIIRTTTVVPAPSAPTNVTPFSNWTNASNWTNWTNTSGVNTSNLNADPQMRRLMSQFAW